MADGQLIEEVAEHFEEAAEVTRRLTGREISFFTVGVGLGVVAGAVAAYFVVDKRLQTKYSKLAEEEISEMREHYLKKAVAAEPKPPIEVVVEEKQPRYSAREQRAIDDVVEKEEAEAQNVFENTDPEVDLSWNWELEVQTRNPEVPYIIHLDEFKQNEPEHDQVSYTYYEQDDTLVDQFKNTIDDMDAAIGLGNLGKWGHGSNDPSIVYIRNVQLGLDFEVLRDRGSYAQESRSIRHSQDRRRRSSRRFDDDDG